jgi:hypothetical protein
MFRRSGHRFAAKNMRHSIIMLLTPARSKAAADEPLRQVEGCGQSDNV